MSLSVQRHPDGSFSMSADGETVKEIFTKMAKLAEVFSGTTTVCGFCYSREGYPVLPNVRDIEGAMFYEYQCTDPKCRGKLALGQKKGKDAELYPRRKYHDKHPEVVAKRAKVNTYMPNNGWEKYTKPDAE
jgi:hypothetical protein